MSNRLLTECWRSYCLRVAFVLIAIVSIGIGCSSSNDSEDPYLRGTFIDSAVQGVDYTTSSGLTGTTDAFGTFTYAAGDTVSFSLS